MRLNGSVLLATIEHSGTNSVLSLMYRSARPIAEYCESATGVTYWAHLWDERMPRIFELAKLMPVVTTARPIADIQASWLRRGKDLSGLEEQSVNYERLLKEVRPYVIVLGTPREEQQ